MTHRMNVTLLVSVAIVILALIGYLLLHTFTREMVGTVTGTVKNEVVEFDCSSQIQTWNSGSGDDIGYLCKARISEDTAFADSNGSAITPGDLAVGDKIRILLARPYNKRDIGTVKAKKIILLDKSA